MAIGVSAAGDVQRGHGLRFLSGERAKAAFLRRQTPDTLGSAPPDRHGSSALKQRFVSDDFSNPSDFRQRYLRLDIATSSRASFYFNDE